MIGGKFIHDKDVDTFLDALTKQEKFPFSTPELRDELKHTFWLLNRVASAKALARKLRSPSWFLKIIKLFWPPVMGDWMMMTRTKSLFNRVTQAIKGV